MTEDINKKLARLANLYSLGDLLAMDKTVKINELIPVDLQMEIEAINDEYTEKEEKLRNQILALEDEIRREVSDLRETVKSDGLMAVYSAPKAVWDSKALDGFAVAHPEINAFRSTGKPSVSFRRR